MQKEVNHKKAMIIANTSWNIYNFRLNIIKILIEQNYTVTVVTPADEFLHYLKNIPEIKHIQLNQLKRKSLNPFQDFFLYKELVRIYKKEKPDITLYH